MPLYFNIVLTQHVTTHFQVCPLSLEERYRNKTQTNNQIDNETDEQTKTNKQRAGSEHCQFSVSEESEASDSRVCFLRTFQCKHWARLSNQS